MKQWIPRDQDQEVVAAAIEEGFTPVQAAVIAGRVSQEQLSAAGSVGGLIAPELRNLDRPDSLPDVDIAAQRIARAVVDSEQIVIASDHDVDGCTSAALWQLALTQMGADPARVRPLTTDRLNEGYGLSDRFVARMLQGHRPGLVITADQGSSDGPRVAALREIGIDTVVTDHHLTGQALPDAACAFVNPLRPGARYPDQAIAGVFVSLLVACQVRQRLVAMGALPAAAPKLGNLCDLVALGTVADCVSLGSSINNRAMVRAGLKQMETGSRPAWAHLGGAGPIDAETLAFHIGPRINAGGRLDSAQTGVRCLLATDTTAAGDLAGELESANLARRAIQDRLVQDALEIARQQVAAGQRALVIPLVNGHAGVHGIVAARIAGRFGRPVICLSPKAASPDVWTGSARSIDGVHIRDALAAVQDQEGVLMSFGGHRAAAGLTLVGADIARFGVAFEAAVGEQLPVSHCLGRVVRVDSLPPGASMATPAGILEELEALQPFGRGFEPVMIRLSGPVINTRSMKGGLHWRFRLGGIGADVVWFNLESGDQPPSVGDQLVVAATLRWNHFRGEKTPQFIAEQVWRDGS